MRITKKFLEKVAVQHNKDYPPEYWKNGGKPSDHTEDVLAKADNTEANLTTNLTTNDTDLKTKEKTTLDIENLVKRLFVARIEERNLTAQIYGKFMTAPITLEECRKELASTKK